MLEAFDQLVQQRVGQGVAPRRIVQRQVGRHGVGPVVSGFEAVGHQGTSFGESSPVPADSPTHIKTLKW
jgi:hypothetical protein